MTGWEPATEAEIAMRDALRAGDQELYFGILARTELLLPVSADALAGRAPMGWGTWTTGGRTHVLAFTSTQALQSCLAEHAGSARRIAYHELAAAWPNLEWWLAVNPGLPIEGYLPAWFVSQLSRGDVRLPGRGASARARGEASARATAAVPPGAPASPAPQSAAATSRPPYAAAGAAPTPARPAPAPAAPAPSPSGLPYRPVAPVMPGPAGTGGAPLSPGPRPGEPEPLPRRPGGLPAEVGPPVQVGPPAQVGPPDQVGSPVQAEPPGRPRRPEALPRRPGTLPGRPVPPPGAVSGAGRVGQAPTVPADRPDQGGVDEARPVAVPPQPGPPSTAGRNSLASAFGVRSALAPESDRSAEPSPGTDSGRASSDGGRASDGGLAMDGGGLTGAGRAFAGGRASDGGRPADGGVAAGVGPPPAPPPVDPSFVPANEVEEALLAAAGDGSTDSFLSTLLLAKVLLPVAGDSPPGALPGEDKFVWHTDTIDGESYVVVFTSPERLNQHLAEPVETVTVKFVQLIRAWPDPAWSFAVNPGTPVGATLPGAQILALASWAAEVGLGAEADIDADIAEAAAIADAEEEAAPAPRSAPEEAARPTMMQKVVQPSQVDYYLDRGYDRVSGFVHRAGEVAHLRTPAKLISSLGLRYSGSPFSAEVGDVHVLRWPAHRPSLYRIPYGGQTEAAMRAMEGWVIERPPFRGNGFAPGDSSEVVAEFKVDSARLPHGAQLWRISPDGTEKLIAILDTDRPVWRRVGEE